MMKLKVADRFTLFAPQGKSLLTQLHLHVVGCLGLELGGGGVTVGTSSFSAASGR